MVNKNQNGKQPKTAFVFSGGASLGAYEVGMLKVIVENGIKPDMIFGTSVGSLNGAFFAFNPTLEGVKELEHLWNKIKFSDVFTPSPLTPVKTIFTFGKNLISPKNLRKLIYENLPNDKIELAEIPLYIVTTDLRTGKEIVFNRGKVLEAIMSSVAIPSVFPPQTMHGMTLVDGGLINNAPISAAIRLGAERVVVFPIGFPSSPEDLPKNLEKIIARTVIYLLNRQLASDFYLYKDQVELIIVPPPEDLYVNPMDFSKAPQMIEAAYKSAKKWFDGGGFHRQFELDPRLHDVHSSSVELVQAIEPDPDKKATERIKEHLVPISEKIKHELSDAKTKVKDSLKSTTASMKEKLHLKKEKKSD